MPWIGGNFFLTRTQMEMNAQYIWSLLKMQGWSLQSVAGMLGNMQTESTINPAIWQNLTPNPKLGFGLVQWTPSTKYTDWCSLQGIPVDDMDSNLKRINFEVDNGIQWIKTSKYNYSFVDFKVKTDTPYNLGMAFLANYERPANPNQTIRGKQAEEWFTFLDGKPPAPVLKFNKMKNIYYGRIF